MDHEIQAGKRRHKEVDGKRKMVMLMDWKSPRGAGGESLGVRILN